MEETLEKLKPGAKVKVTQQIAARDHTWTTEVSGTILELEQSKTGSWFAHSKDQRLWLDRLTIRKENGEVSVLNLDQYSRIEVM